MKRLHRCCWRVSVNRSLPGLNSHQGRASVEVTSTCWLPTHPRARARAHTQTHMTKQTHGVADMQSRSAHLTVAGRKKAPWIRPRCLRLAAPPPFHLFPVRREKRRRERGGGKTSQEKVRRFSSPRVKTSVALVSERSSDTSIRPSKRTDHRQRGRNQT